MIEVIITDDHPLVREGIKKVISNEIDISVAGEAEDASELMPMLEEGLPDLLILDITMPGKSGIDILKDLNTRYPNLHVLMLSIHPEERFAVRALKAGAMGYISKSSISKELVNAIRKIAVQNRKYITPEVAEQLALQIDHSSDRPPHETLSDREFEVLCMIANGQEINDIADELSLSPHTVHTYRSRIKEKMNIESNVEMTRYAMENGLIS